MNDMMNLLKKYWWVILVFLAFFFPQGTKQKIYRKVKSKRKASQRMAWKGYYSTKDKLKKKTGYRYSSKRRAAQSLNKAKQAAYKANKKFEAVIKKQDLAFNRRMKRTL
jgi:hypothetical protein